MPVAAFARTRAIVGHTDSGFARRSRGKTMPCQIPFNITSLSLSARIAIALHLFRGYCARRALTHPEIDRFVEHLWEFIGLQAGRDVFDNWVKNTPPLTGAGLGDPFPPGFDDVLMAAEVSESEFRSALSNTTEVLYFSMYGAADEEASRRFLVDLAALTQTLGVVWPDMSCFANSLWSECHGWGKRLSAKDLEDWRAAGRSDQ